LLKAVEEGLRANSDGALVRLLDDYQRQPEPIAVNFRTLVPWVSMGDRATHYIHPYPAKLIPHIPAFFLSNAILSKPGDFVLDPFCGSGTVTLESILQERHGFGADANPLARLIASVKTCALSPHDAETTLRRTMRRANQIKQAPVPPVQNLRYWFYPHVIDRLARMLKAINGIEHVPMRQFFEVSFSACVRSVSLADPRLSVPVRLRYDQYPPGHPFRESMNARVTSLKRQDVFATFEMIAIANIRRLAALKQMLRSNDYKGSVIGVDARQLPSVYSAAGSAKSAVDLVITSPPYAGAQKYIRASGLSIGWLSFANETSLRELESKNIGREHINEKERIPREKLSLLDADDRLAEIDDKNPLRAQIAFTYLIEMREALREVASALKPSGFLVLVAGNNRICGNDFYTQAYLCQMLTDLGLTLRLELIDDIKSRGLMTRRNATASLITREWIHVFQKAPL
jgi:DNA modification methylase